MNFRTAPFSPSRARSSGRHPRGPFVIVNGRSRSALNEPGGVLEQRSNQGLAPTPAVPQAATSRDAPQLSFIVTMYRTSAFVEALCVRASDAARSLQLSFEVVLV